MTAEALEDDGPDILGAALSYAARGWHIFPVAGKYPIEVGSGNRMKWSRDSTTDAEQIVAWYAGSSNLGIGLDCGKSGLVALDGDRLSDFMAWLGEDAAHLAGSVAWQGNPSRATFLFTQPAEVVGCPVMDWGEIKGRGGYVVLPPSPHPDFGSYRMLKDEGTPAVLPEVIRTRLKGRAKVASGVEPLPPEWLDAGEPCALVAPVLDTALACMFGEKAQPAMRDASMALLRLGEQGHQGTGTALRTLAESYVAVVTKPRDGGKQTRSTAVAEGEVQRAYTGAVPEIKATPTGWRHNCRGPLCQREQRPLPDDLVQLATATSPQQPTPTPSGADVGVGDPDSPEMLEAWQQFVATKLPAIDWHALWADESEEEWIIEPLLPARRQVALYSAPKVGKSLLLLEMAAAIAAGHRECLGTVLGEPKVVLYVDFENDPRSDIRERLISMGYGPDDLANLRYLSYPEMRKLDTEQGAAELIAAVRFHRAEVVVIDTVSRSIGGEENANDTWLAFYRHAGLTLKRERVALIRLDHAGKDEAKGQRGGSAKAGDVDAVWRMSRLTDTVFRLECEMNRMPVTEKVLTLHREETPDLRHRVDAKGQLAAYTVQLEKWTEVMRRAGFLYGPDRGGVSITEAFKTMRAMQADGRLEEAPPNHWVRKVRKSLEDVPRPFEIGGE